MRLCLVLDLRGGDSGPASSASSTIEDGRGESVGFCISNSKAMRSASADSLIVAVDFERSRVVGWASFRLFIEDLDVLLCGELSSYPEGCDSEVLDMDNRLIPILPLNTPPKRAFLPSLSTPSKLGRQNIRRHQRFSTSAIEFRATSQSQGIIL